MMQINTILKNLIHACLLIGMAAVASATLADQKIKTKSNIKNDRVAQSSASTNCVNTDLTAVAAKQEKTSDEKSSAPALPECTPAKTQTEAEASN